MVPSKRAGTVGAAVRDQNPEPIHALVRSQLAGGASALDVNVGPASADPLVAMEWLVKTVREATDATLAIDATKPEVIERGLEIAGPGSIINSTKGQQEQLDIFVPMAVRHQASVIALTIDENGIPRDANGRSETLFFHHRSLRHFSQSPSSTTFLPRTVNFVFNSSGILMLSKVSL